MSERWLDAPDTPREVRELLGRGRPPRALDFEARERSRRRIAGLAALPAAGAVFWIQHVAIGAVLGTVVGAAVVAPRLLSSNEEPAGPAKVQLPSAKKPRAVPPPAPSTARAPAEPSRASSELEAPRERDKSSLPPAPASADAEKGDHALSREAKLLERARSLLESDPNGALALLERHGVEFPKGALGLEREFLTVDALVRLGRKDEARARAKLLERRAPGTLYDERLERLLGEP